MTNIYLEEIEKLDEIKTQYNSIYNNQNFLEYDDVYNLTQNLLSKKLKFKLKNIFLIISYKKYCTKYNELSQIIANAKSDIDKHNNQVFSKEKENFTNICGPVEGRNLDDQQIDAIVRKNKNQLVIAAAGAGKTTTIIGKVKYLLLTKQCMPQDILLLSFTNASAAEMKERIKKETTLNLDVMTFHKLGLEIIKNSSNSN